jgi:voltage-gated potassium channel
MVPTKVKFGSLLVMVVVLLTAGTVIYHALEQWSFVDSFYFTGITLTTIGYGDLVPTHDISKLVTVGFALSGVAIFIYTLGVLASYYVQRGQQFEEYEAQKIKEIVSNISLPFKKEKKKKP